jgi:hypothetical protein
MDQSADHSSPQTIDVTVLVHGQSARYSHRLRERPMKVTGPLSSRLLSKFAKRASIVGLGRTLAASPAALRLATNMPQAGGSGGRRQGSPALPFFAEKKWDVNTSISNPRKILWGSPVLSTYKVHRYNFLGGGHLNKYFSMTQKPVLRGEVCARARSLVHT